MKKLPLGIQSFRKIIEGEYVYVDKTRYIYDLINNANYYFLSRPRRFGKSLLLDTIAETFSGDKELFKGLWIYGSGFEFDGRPVLRFDMSNIANDTPETLKGSLIVALKKYVKAEGFDIDYSTPSDMFKSLIESLYGKYNRRIVVLVDEYDKPILDRIDDITIAEANRDILRGFYGVLKSMDPYLKLALITGITKFTKTSIFSGLNNMLDITLMEEYADICGIGIDDLDRYFGEHIGNLSSLEHYSYIANIRAKILEWYDGYSWNGKTRVINPHSLLSLFLAKEFESYWYASGTPSFLLKVIKERPESFLALRNLEISERTLSNFDIRRMELEPLLFQTGYLTVSEKRYHGVSVNYLMKIPNLEVKDALYKSIIAEFTQRGEAFAETAHRRIRESLETGDMQNMLAILRGLFASIPYQLHVDKEAYYHSILFAVLDLLGFTVDAEVSVSGGRIDAVLEQSDKVFIMEFKYRDCPQDAAHEQRRKLFDEALEEGMKQINDRGYADKYAGSGKSVYKAAFAFLGRDEIEMRVEPVHCKL